MIKLIASYSKKVGLPGFSSVGLNLAVETELHSLDEVTQQSEQLYKLLQNSVDERLQQSPGFVPPHGFGVENNNCAWNCSDKQRSLVETIIAENKIDSKDIDALSRARFNLGLTELNKLQMSGLIDELLERNGKNDRSNSKSGRRFQRLNGGAAEEAKA